MFLLDQPVVNDSVEEESPFSSYLIKACFTDVPEKDYPIHCSKAFPETCPSRLAMLQQMSISATLSTPILVGSDIWRVCLLDGLPLWTISAPEKLYKAW
jgi:hypothetical protein